MIRRCPVILLVIMLLLSGCSHKGVIPPGKMSKILHDMYVLDAQIEYARDYSNMADTTSVYGALFDEYGYSVEDFNRSLDYYLHHPVKFKEIFKVTFDRFESEEKSMEARMGTKEEELPVPDEPAARTPRGRRNRQELSSPDETELE